MQYCLICFKDLYLEHDLVNLITERVICNNCFQKFEVLYIKKVLNRAEGLIIYKYNDFIRQLIVQYKGFYDYVLKDAFLAYYLEELKLEFRGYTIVPIPSNEDEDKARGFNHVEEIFKNLKLPILPILYKKAQWKQSEKKFHERQKVGEIMAIKVNYKVPQKVLIVDDILTTGATIKAAIGLVRKAGAKKVKFLVIAEN